MAEKESIAEKIFVAGLILQEPETNYRDYFEQFGPIKDIHFKRRNPSDHLHLGRGYLVADVKTIKNIFAGAPHFYKDKKVDVKPFFIGEKLKQYGSEYQKRRIYVDNIPKMWEDIHLREYFQQFGSLENSYILLDTRSGKRKDKAFLLFEKLEDAEMLLKVKDRQHNMNGMKLNRILKAQESKKAKKLNVHSSKLPFKKQSHKQNSSNQLFKTKKLDYQKSDSKNYHNQTKKNLKLNLSTPLKPRKMLKKQRANIEEICEGRESSSSYSQSESSVYSSKFEDSSSETQNNSLPKMFFTHLDPPNLQFCQMKNEFFHHSRSVFQRYYSDKPKSFPTQSSLKINIFKESKNNNNNNRFCWNYQHQRWNIKFNCDIQSRLSPSSYSLSHHDSAKLGPNTIHSRYR